ncbi:Mediator of RNA polymerase II transcription subunit 23 [Schistosoma japonicum]|nr:Mediator of RNA polymerase II transcription subunit 23 [Schistosoma japonicum]KAH8864728.1 Mediator of RNA polymerase II transcription subunit 23 [Schistosoma japonicum]KAH8864730.1 Mediator of RNA polymerase II transcription subunit 23 [Schistosoma japonicum]
MLEESLGSMISDEGMSLMNMDAVRSQKLWGEILHQKSKFRALDCLISRLSNVKHERIVMRILWSIDFAIEKALFSPREVAHSIVCSDSLRVESPILFRCSFKLLLKLIFFLDYKSNREVFNKSIEKSSQFTEKMFSERSLFYTIDPSLELIQLLLCREMCLMPAYFAMHELIRNFSSEFRDAPEFVRSGFNKFMDSFKKPARLLYSRVYHAMTPFCGITSLSAPGYRLDSSNLVLTSIKGAMRYPDSLTSSQLPLLCTVLGQLRSFELTTGMLDLISGKVKTRSMGLELALVELIVQVMELLECTHDDTWNRSMFEHLISVMITFMLNSTVRFNEIVVKLNSKLEGRTWTKSSHYVMWFVLNATSGFIGKNMLTDFVPCLRLFDILFPEAEDPDRAIDLPIPCCNRKDPIGQSNDNDIISTQEDGVVPKTILGKELSSTEENTNFNIPPFPVSRKIDTDTSEDLSRELTISSGNENEVSEQSSTSAEDSDNEYSQNETESLLPPHFRSSTACCKRQGRLLHLATAPVCLWQHVLRKSRLGQDHLPRVMPPALRPIEARISRRMQALVQSISSTQMSNNSIHLVSKLTWNQLFIVLNAFSTDNEVSQLIQKLIDIFWSNESSNDNPKLEHGFLWSRLIRNGKVELPYDLSACGRLQPLSHHLMHTMSVHLRMLVLHFFLQKFSVLPNSNVLCTPAVVETFCRILACREVESNSVNRILCLLTKLQPSWSYNVSNTDPKNALPCCTTNAKVSNYSTCSLVFTLLDTLGFRLADILTPEVRINTLTSLISLLKLWSNWSTSVIDNREPKNNYEEVTSEIPLELQYLLDWNILKFSRSIQAPDCVIYGFCSALTSPTLTQTQAGINNLPPVGNPLCVTQPQTLNMISQQGSLMSNTSGGSIPVNRPFIPANPGIPTSISSGIMQPPSDSLLSSNTTVNSLTGGSGSTGFPNSIPGYPFLMCDNVEVNRFVLHSLLQMYHTFDLEEVSGIRPNLVEQIRSMCEQCGPNSLIDLPQLITKRLPDFLVLVIRQLTNPTTGDFNICSFPSSDPMSVESIESTLAYTDKSTSLPKLCSVVQEEYISFSNGNIDWSNAVNRGNVFLCLLFRSFMEHQNIPSKAISLLNRMSSKFLNRQLRMLCDYVVASLTFITQVNFTTEKCLSTLSDFCIRWRVVPFDRFVLFLLMHTRYQHSQLDTVNRIIVYLFTQSDQLISGINYLNTKYEATSSSISDTNTRRASPHTDPLSSRHWFSCVLALHEIIPDQWITYPKTCAISYNNCTSTDSLDEMDKPPHLPVIYGHLLLRLLPLLEVVLIQFLMCELPLVLLIPFCQVIAPLFRYHRRPVNICYTVLHDHAEFTVKSLLYKLPNLVHHTYHLQSPGTVCLDTSSSPELDIDKSPWIFNRLSCQLIVYCIISKHQQLSVKAALSRSKHLDQQHSTINGLFTQRGWKNLESCVKQSEVFFDLICKNMITADTDCNIIRDNTDQCVINIILNPETFETQLKSMFVNWYNSNASKYNSEYLFGLIDPICKSNQRHGISGHSAAWRTWSYEESVCIQTAGLYAASIELMSSLMLPNELTSVVSDLLTIRAKHANFNQLLNVTGALAVILPSVYRLSLFKFCVTLFNDRIICDTTPDSTEMNAEKTFTGVTDLKSISNSSNMKWRRSSRAMRHKKLLDINLTSVDNFASLASSADETTLPSKPPKVSSHFFEIYLPLDQKTNSSLANSRSNGNYGVYETTHKNAETNVTENFNGSDSSSDVMGYLIKANLWHSIWAHANTTHLASLPSIFADLILPELRNEAQLLLAFYLVAPLMGSLHSERPAKLVDLTAELYRAVWKVDNILRRSTPKKSDDLEVSMDISNSKQLSEHLPLETGIPLVHVDTIADLLYHIKYMYVGNGVLDQVRPLLPQLRPSLRKRLKFILPQDSLVSQQQQQSDSYPVFEGRIYRASVKPPMCNEDF